MKNLMERAKSKLHNDMETQSIFAQNSKSRARTYVRYIIWISSIDFEGVLSIFIS